METTAAVRALLDVTSSVASIVAILAALIAWYRSARRPIRLARTVVHRAPNATTFFLEFLNRKDYPVTVTDVDAYKGKTYTVERKHGGRIEYSAAYSSTRQLFRAVTNFVVEAHGRDHCRIEIPRAIDVPSKYLVLASTSHGHHELWCKDIEVVDVGIGEIRLVQLRCRYESRWKAWARYVWERLKPWNR